MDKKINLGDVLVTDEGRNPYTYRGVFCSGPQRAAALRRFRDGADTANLVLWYAPCCGGARRITAPEVDWNGLRA